MEQSIFLGNIATMNQLVGRRMSGLGDPFDDYIASTGGSTSSTPPSSTATKPKTSVSDWFNNIFKAAGTASDIYKATQNQPGGNGQLPPGYQPTGLSTTAKVGIGLGVAGLLGLGIYAATRGGKKAKS